MTTTKFENIAASDLIVDANVRTELADADLKGLRESIAERGVVQPLVGWRDAEDRVHVLMGQRRALASQDLGATVPVYVHDAEPKDADRIIDQWVENENRAGLTNRDKAAAAAQLALEGLSDTKISKAVGMKRTEVKAARIVGQVRDDDFAEQANSMTLDQAAAIAEFEDEPETVAALVEAVQNNPYRVDHLISRARQDRGERRAAASLTEELTAQGVTVVSADDDAEFVPVFRLENSEGESIDAENHKDCPGRAVAIERVSSWDQDQWLDEAAEGARTEPHATVDGVTVYAEEGCTDLATGGHTDRWATRSNGSTPKKAAEMTEEEREEARAARREVIDNNRAWDAATEVRQAWVREFATRKTPPKGHERVLLACAAHFDYSLKAAHEAVSWLGWDLNAEMKGATPKRLAQIHTAICLARWETTNHRNAWRYADRAGQMMLTALAEWGYELSEVEKRARDLKDDAPF